MQISNNKTKMALMKELKHNSIVKVDRRNDY